MATSSLCQIPLNQEDLDSPEEYTVSKEDFAHQQRVPVGKSLMR